MVLQRAVICIYLFSFSFVLPVVKAQYTVDSFLQLKGADRYYELYHTYGFFIKNKPKFTALNNLVDAKGDASDKLIKYYWLEKRPILDTAMYSQKGLFIYQELLQKAEQIPNYYIVAGYHMTMGVIHNRMKAFNKSFESQLLCLDALEKDPEKKYFQQSWWLHLIANKFYEFKDYSKAVQLAKIASTLSYKYTPDGVWFERVNTNLIGMSYLKNAQYDSAKFWLEKTRILAIAAKDTTWLGIATGNLGTLSYLENNCKDAIEKYVQAIIWCKKGGVWDNVASFSNNLADCYLIAGNYSAIPTLLKESDVANKKDTNNIAYLANCIKLFSITEQYYRKKQNWPLSIQFADSARKYQLLYNIFFDVNKKIKAEGEFAFKNKELQNQLLFNQNKLQQQAIVFGSIALLLTICFTIFYIKRANLRKRLIEKNKEIVELQLLNTKKELQQFTNSLVEKNRLIDSYIGEINKLENTISKTATNEQTATLQQLKNSTILTTEDWTNFKLLFEKIYPNFFSYFKINHPTITQAEIRFLAFVKLDISPKDMAGLLGVSYEAIRTLRFRLKKKLNVTDVKDIEQLVLNIS